MINFFIPCIHSLLFVKVRTGESPEEHWRSMSPAHLRIILFQVRLYYKSIVFVISMAESLNFLLGWFQQTETNPASVNLNIYNFNIYDVPQSQFCTVWNLGAMK